MADLGARAQQVQRAQRPVGGEEGVRRGRRWIEEVSVDLWQGRSAQISAKRAGGSWRTMLRSSGGSDRKGNGFSGASGRMECRLFPRSLAYILEDLAVSCSRYGGRRQWSGRGWDGQDGVLSAGTSSAGLARGALHGCVLHTGSEGNDDEE